VRWESLFADLAAQADALEAAERAVEVRDRIRAEVGGLGIVDRLRPALGAPLRLRTPAGAVRGVLSRVGPDWLLLDGEAGREVLVPLAAVSAVAGLPRQSAVPGSMDAVTARLRLWFVLRRIARDRSAVLVQLTDGSTLAATLDRVGSDFVDVAVTAPGEARRSRAVREVLLVPHAALVSVSRLAD
jgi:hypothetical protein